MSSVDLDLVPVVLEVGGGQTPRGMLGVRLGPAFRAGLVHDLVRPLERTRLLEAPVTTLFHVRAPDCATGWNATSVLARPCKEIPSQARDGSTFAPDRRRRQPRAGAGMATVHTMAEDFDPQAMVVRFQERARAVKARGIPPIEGPERKRFVERMQLDFMDFAMLGDATASLEDGVLVLRIDLRPAGAG